MGKLHVAIIALIIAILAGVLPIVLSPSRLYSVFGGEHLFARAVRLSVPQGAALAELEAVVGPGTPLGGEPSWMREMAEQSPQYFPDGFSPNDSYVRYDFPSTTFYFQVRDGRLVNHDPAMVTADTGIVGLAK